MNNIELDAQVTERETGAGLLRRVHDFLSRFVAFPSKEAHAAVSLWVIHAHLMDRWDSTPRLAFLSAEPASGKTRALEILELLVPRPILPVNASPSYLFTCVASEHGLPTVLFDEIDTVFGPKAKETNEDVRGFLNAGHRKGQIFGRCIYQGGGKRTIEELPAYCAVAFAGLGWLPDTILSRSVVIRMRRRHAGERVEPYRRRMHGPEGERLRRQIESWAQSQPPEITDWPEMPDAIQDRDADVWETLLAVADLVGGAWPKRARDAAVALVADSKELEPSLNIRLLTDLRQIFDADALSSKTILQRLWDIEESPWRDLKGKALDERGLAHRLRQFGIKSKTVRPNGPDGPTPKGYSKADFHDVWARYLQSLEKSATSATSAATLETQTPSDTARPSSVAGVADVAHFQRCVCAHCNRPGDLQEAYFGDAHAWLHRDCQTAWMAAQDDGLSIPAYLDRRGELQSN
jgi:Protein of unknown function (DUF3631)